MKYTMKTIEGCAVRTRQGGNRRCDRSLRRGRTVTQALNNALLDTVLVSDIEVDGRITLRLILNEQGVYIHLAEDKSQVAGSSDYGTKPLGCLNQ
jgi:hypothetical protein